MFVQRPTSTQRPKVRLWATLYTRRPSVIYDLPNVPDLPNVRRLEHKSPNVGRWEGCEILEGPIV